MADRDHGLPHAVVRRSNELYRTDAGVRQGVDMVVPPEVFEQYRLGYRCIACHHFPQPSAFPDNCCEPYCRFPMRRDQMARLEAGHRGEEDLWPTRTDEELRGDLEDQGVWLPSSN